MRCGLRALLLFFLLLLPFLAGCFGGDAEDGNSGSGESRRGWSLFVADAPHPDGYVLAANSTSLAVNETLWARAAMRGMFQQPLDAGQGVTLSWRGEGPLRPELEVRWGPEQEIKIETLRCGDAPANGSREGWFDAEIHPREDGCDIRLAAHARLHPEGNSFTLVWSLFVMAPPGEERATVRFLASPEWKN